MTENFINYEKPLNRNNVEKETIDFYQCFSIEDFKIFERFFWESERNDLSLCCN